MKHDVLLAGKGLCGPSGFNNAVIELNLSYMKISGSTLFKNMRG